MAIDEAHPNSGYRLLARDGDVLGIDRFGAIAPDEPVYEELGLTLERLMEIAAKLVSRADLRVGYVDPAAPFGPTTHHRSRASRHPFDPIPREG